MELESKGIYLLWGEDINKLPIFIKVDWPKNKSGYFKADTQKGICT